MNIALIYMNHHARKQFTFVLYSHLQNGPRCRDDLPSQGQEQCKDPPTGPARAEAEQGEREK